MKIFSQENNELGEAPLWHSNRSSLFWLDILNRTLFEKKWGSSTQTADRSWVLPEFTSAMAQSQHEDNSLWMVTDKSFGKFDLQRNLYTPLIRLDISDSFRANDGGVSPDGSFWFGTMEWSPTGTNGNIYSISPTAVLSKQNPKIGIPNTFCWAADGKTIYISDSFQQKIFSFDVDNNIMTEHSATTVVDLSASSSTPDGGAIDADGFLWNAHWDGYKIVKYDRSGKSHQELPLPVPKPTSCCFGGPENRHLFVTSARTDMDQKDLLEFPLSGSVFVQELSCPGLPIRPFRLSQ